MAPGPADSTNAPARRALSTGLVVAAALTLRAAGADPDREITAAPGFEVDLVHVVAREHGSWVCLAVDGRGRLIAGDQAGGLYRLEPAAPGAPPAATRVEAIDLAVGGAQGLLCVGGDLYCVTNGDFADGPGLYRLRDTDGDDRYDEGRLLRAIPGEGGEHGRHGIALGPDGRLYVVAGNHVPPPAPERSTVPRVWGEDHLLPRLSDPRGHAVGILAPGGWICRTDLDGAVWELFAVGFRNPYDLAFDSEGELFTFDSDMEWDMGAPWYRPTRVNHVTSGAEFGWRSGTAKWPAHYPDSLPGILDIGPGSPTGVLFGTGAAFPERYRRALYLLDWTYGTMYAVHLEPAGASYRATHETFLAGRPLPLTDAVVNPVDGALYVTVGGRGVASAVYRVRYAGDEPIGTVRSGPTPSAPPRERRRALEALHRPEAPADALDEVWRALGDDDRFVRYAARIALEHQPVERWARRLRGEPRTRARLAGLLALARVGGPAQRDDLVEGLRSLRWTGLAREDRLELLRVWALCFIRHGPPGDEPAALLAEELEAVYPAGDDDLDRELCDLLVALASPLVVARTIPLMEASTAPAAGPDPALLARSDAYGEVVRRMALAPPPRQSMHYALALRQAARGWTPELRERYFRWFESARRAHGGMSFTGFLDRIRADALAQVPEPQRARYEQIGRAAPAGVDPATLPHGPGRAWTADEVVALAESGLTHRRYRRGRQLYVGARCAQCHRLAGEGGAGGPDLTGVGSRFTLRDLVEAIVEPSRTISDQYRLEELRLEDDRVFLGRVVDQDDEAIRVMPSLLAPDVTLRIERAAIRARRPSAVSPMMPHLVDGMAADEVLDLLAYVLSGGDPTSPMFDGADAPP